MAKRASGIGFTPLANFTNAKKQRTSNNALISFSTFTRGNEAEQRSIASLTNNPSMSSFHSDITPDNKIEDPSVSPIIVTFPVKFASNVDTSFSKGVIVVAEYDQKKTPETSGPFRSVVVRTAANPPAIENKDCIAVVLAESCSKPDAARNYTCLFSGAIADTTELNMGTHTHTAGQIVYAELNSALTDGQTNGHINFTDTYTANTILTFQVIYEQKGLSNALVTILPTRITMPASGSA